MTPYYDIQFSFTNLDAFQKCPESMRQQYVTKKFKRIFTPQITGGVDAHEVLDKRIKREIVLPETLAAAEPLVASFERIGTVESEVSLAVDHYWNPATFWTGWLRGKFDVVVRGRGKAVIGDWKTGNVWEKGDQLEIGAHLLMQNDKTIDEVTGVNLWLKENRIGTPYKFKRGDGATARLTRKMREIESLKKDQEWPKRPSALCGWCPVLTCAHNPGAK